MSMYYNYDKLFSFDFLLGIVIGERGVGKSYGIKKYVIKRFIKTGEQFIYMRRYKTELDTALATFWDDIQPDGDFEGHYLSVKKSKMLTKLMCDGEVCGYAVPLSTANILKSTPFPNVKYLIFDEFLLDTGGTYRFLKHEATLLLETMESVFRLRDGKTILIGNALNVHASPYFAYWDLELPIGDNEFRTFKDGAIVVNYIRNMEYRKAKKASRFGKLIDGTIYGNYLINNRDLRENNDFIDKRPPNAKFEAVIIINGVYIGIWNGFNGFMYLSEKYDPNTSFKYAFNYNDHTEETIFNSARENFHIKWLIHCYKIGMLKFENQKVKTAAVSLLNRCIAL